MMYTRIVIFLSLALLFFMLGKGCGDKSEQVQTDIDALRDSITMYQVQAGFLGVELNKAERRMQEMEAAHEADKNNVASKAGSVTRRQQDVKTIVKYVSDDCDSLADAAVKLSDAVDQYKEEVKVAEVNADKLIGSKNEVIENLKMQLKECNDAILQIDKKLPEIKKEAKARNQYYVGAFVAGNALSPIYGAGVTATVINKTGQMFDAGVMMSRGQTYALAGVKLRLSLKK